MTPRYRTRRALLAILIAGFAAALSWWEWTKPNLYVADPLPSRFQLAWWVTPVEFDREFRPAPNRLYDVFFLKGTEVGWACGEQGTILHTENGGKTWAAQNSGVRFVVRSIFFLTAELGWAASANGEVLTTSNGGKVWETIADLTESPTAIQFLDENKGLLASRNGTIQRTTDGGRTWKQVAAHFDDAYEGMHFPDVENGWVVNERSSILHSADGGRAGRVCGLQKASTGPYSLWIRKRAGLPGV